MIEILCAGQLAVDILVRPVDKLDFEDDTQRVEVIEIRNGGDSLNVAIGLQKLGHWVGFAGKIGNDLQGDFLTQVIDQAGVDRRGLIRAANLTTCTVLVVINSTGERTFFYLGGANDQFALKDINRSLLDEAAVVHVGGTYLLPQFDGEGATGLFRKARSAGKLTSMDVTWDTQGRWRKTIEPCFPYLSFFLPSYKEAAKITDRQKPEEMGALLQDWGVENVVIKLGAEGCYVKPAGDKGFTIPAFQTSVVDTTGAGDSFVAGFLTGVLRGWDLRECAGLGCAVAALNIQCLGATEGMPTFQRAIQFLNRGSHERHIDNLRTNVQDLLRRADEEGFAVPAFNYSDIWDFLAIAEAAESEQAPVFISSNQRVVTDIGIDLCGAFGKAAMLKASVPLIHHLDHCSKAELCCSAVDNHYPSVMIDASMYPLDVNIRTVKQVVAYAHAHGVAVEGEIGRIKGAGIEGEFTGDDFLARVDEVLRFVAETKVDSLAVGIGTAHGFYQGKPEIHFDRLQEIDAAVTVPLVLHGGTGIPQAHIRRAIRAGINKVNVGTTIHCTYMNAVRAELARAGENAYTLDVMEPVREAIRDEVRKWIRFCMASGRAVP